MVTGHYGMVAKYSENARLSLFIMENITSFYQWLLCKTAQKMI